MEWRPALVRLGRGGLPLSVIFALQTLQPHFLLLHPARRAHWVKRNLRPAARPAMAAMHERLALTSMVLAEQKGLPTTRRESTIFRLLASHWSWTDVADQLIAPTLVYATWTKRRKKLKCCWLGQRIRKIGLSCFTVVSPLDWLGFHQ